MKSAIDKDMLIQNKIDIEVEKKSNDYIRDLQRYKKKIIKKDKEIQELKRDVIDKGYLIVEIHKLWQKRFEWFGNKIIDYVDAYNGDMDLLNDLMKLKDEANTKEFEKNEIEN